MDSDSDDDVEDPSGDSLDLTECLRLQHAELEMLESMFPDELFVSDPEAVVLFKSFVEALDDVDVDILKADLLPNLSFDIKLDLDCLSRSSSNSKSVDDKVELSLTLPLYYPFMRPTVMLRTGMDRRRENRLRQSTDSFLACHPEGELFVANLIEFVRETIAETKDDVVGDKEESTNNNGKTSKLVRMWIYSHHIYSMQKRKFILEWSRELDLTGFSMPGKPGIVCVEGVESAVDDLWTRLRKLNWKRLAIKERETIWDGKAEKEKAVEDVGGDEEEEEEVSKTDVDLPESFEYTDHKSFQNKTAQTNNFGRKFVEFEEISFDVKQGQGRNYHMDMGKFLDFLKKYDCERIFKMYFGVDGSSH